MKAATRKTINNKLHKLTANTYFDAIPLNLMNGVLAEKAMFMADEDGTPWSGFLCGREGRASFAIGYQDHTTTRTGMVEMDKAALTVTWYKMQSGRYEVVAYVF